MTQSEYGSVYAILEKIDASSLSNVFILLTYYIMMLSLWYLGSMFEIKTFSLIYFENRVHVTHNNPFTMADTSLESILLVLHITTAFWVLLDNFTSSAFQSVSCFITRYSTVYGRISKMLMPCMRVTFEPMSNGVEVSLDAIWITESIQVCIINRI